MRNLFRLSILAVVGLLATTVTVNAQFEPTTQAPAAPAAVSVSQAPASATATATATAPGLSKEAVQQIAREAVASELKAAPYASADHTHGNNWVGGLALILALVAIGLFIWFRRGILGKISAKLDSKGFDDWIKSVFDPAIAGLKNDNTELAERTKKADDALSTRIKALEPPDPKDAAKAEVDAAQQELDQAIKDKKFDLVPDLGKKLATAQEKLAKLTPQPAAPKGKDEELSDEDKAKLAGKLKGGGKGPAGLAATVLTLCLALILPSAMFGQNCYNTITGKTPGSVKQSIAVAGMNNEFVCSGSGKVEITKLDGSVLYTPTITKPSPLTFEFNPTAPGRAIVKVNGRSVSALMITADVNQAFLVGGAIDLASAHRASAADQVARKSAQQANDAVTNMGSRLGSRLDSTQTAVATLDERMKKIAEEGSSLDLRVRNLEDRPQVNIAPLQARVAALEAELSRVKATANTALQTAQTADSKASDALSRYESMGLARFKTGLFSSQTVVQATEAAQTRAQKEAERQAAKAAKKQK